MSFIALFGGVFGHAQDCDLLVDAAWQLKNHPDVTFIFAGGGPAYSRVAEKVRLQALSRVILLPFLAPTEYHRLLAQAGCGLATLKAGVASIPSKLWVYMAFGIPVVAALPPGVAASMIQESGGGIRVPTGDVDGFANAIARLAEFPKIRCEMAQNARKYAEQYLSVDRAIEDWERLLVELVRGSQTHGSEGSRGTGRAGDDDSVV